MPLSPLMLMSRSRNFATWNPSDKNADIALSSGNRVATSAGGDVTTHRGVRATVGKSAGKWYWELTFTSGLYMQPGVAVISEGLSFDTSYTGLTDTSIYHPNGRTYAPSPGGTAYGATFAAGDVIGLALDMGAGTLVMYKNNSSQGTMRSGISGTYYPYLLEFDGDVTVATANFGASTMAYAAPSGFNQGLWL